MSFRLKTILGIAFIEFILLSLLVVSGLYYLRSSNESQFLNRGKTTAQLAATMTSDAVVALDLASLDVLVEQTLRNPDVVYMRVRHTNGTVLSQGGDAAALDRPFHVDINMTDAQKDMVLDTAAEIRIAGKVLGQVELGLDIATFNSVMTEAKKWMLSVAALEICLVALFGYGLGLLLTRQLLAIREGAARVADGAFGHTIVVRSQDELGQTAKSFNKMSKALAEFAAEVESARQLAEEKRALAESMLGDAVSSLHEGVVILDAQYKLIHMNQAFIDLMPNRHAMTRVNIEKYVLNQLHTPTEDLAELPGATDAQWTVKLDEDDRYILNSRVPMNSGGWVFMKTDISEIYKAQERQRQLELELFQASKLEALGTLAGGIAHEINTPIQYIGDNLRFLSKSSDGLIKIIDAQQELAQVAQAVPALHKQAQECCDLYQELDIGFLRDEMMDSVEQSIDGIHQVSRIVSAMKEFSHPTHKEKAPIDLNEVIRRATVVCQSEWKAVADLELELAEDLPRIIALEGELNQVILNLVINSAHAIADNKARIGNGLILIKTIPAQEYVTLEIMDNGAGIPEDIQKKIFEPFFTTKDVGKGTGQGLAICHDVVVNKHGGEINLKSQLNVGTTFTIKLPISLNESVSKRVLEFL